MIAAGLESKGVSVVGSVPATLPTPSFPNIDADQWPKLVPLSLLIAVVVMVQTAATTRAFPSQTGKPADVDRDFLGAGAGSVLAGLFGAFPVNASPPRTGIVAETGGQTQMSGLMAAGIVLALSVFGATLLKHVPNAALGGVLGPRLCQERLGLRGTPQRDQRRAAAHLGLRDPVAQKIPLLAGKKRDSAPKQPSAGQKMLCKSISYLSCEGAAGSGICRVWQRIGSGI